MARGAVLSPAFPRRAPHSESLLPSSLPPPANFGAALLLVLTHLVRELLGKIRQQSLHRTKERCALRIDR